MHLLVTQGTHTHTHTHTYAHYHTLSASRGLYSFHASDFGDGRLELSLCPDPVMSSPLYTKEADKDHKLQACTDTFVTEPDCSGALGALAAIHARWPPSMVRKFGMP